MADVKWIKIVTDIFDDEKILLIESMPSADSIIVIWFKLLCLAGKTNNSGVFILNDNFPYTDEMLATIFRRDINTVRLALSTFEKFGMIEVVNNVITIPKWSKHQSLDQLEERKKYMKEYMQNYREKQKLIAGGDGKVNSKVNSKVNVNSLDKNREDKNRLEEDKNKSTTTKKQKHKYGEYQHVLLTDDELNKLNTEFGSSLANDSITYLDEYIEMKGTKYKSCYLAIRKWVIDAVTRKEQQQVRNKPSSGINNLRELYQEEQENEQKGNYSSPYDFGE